MTRHIEVPSQRTFRAGKYVFGVETLFPTFRQTALPGAFCTIPELLERFPRQVVRQGLGLAKQVPDYQYHYSGSDERYAGGLMPATTIPADSLLQIKNGRAYGRDCVIYGPDGTGLQEFDYVGKRLTTLRENIIGGRMNPRHWKHALLSQWNKNRLPAMQKLPGKVVALNAPSSQNYFHWMVEILPRLRTLQKSGVVPDWYLVDAYTPFQLETLRAFGVPLDRVIQPYAGMHVEADELLVPSYGFPSASREVGAELVQRIGAKTSSTSPGRIFINRRGSRRPANSQGFKALLRRFGFEEHFLEDHSLPKQIELFRNAEAVVAMHGAGLTNLIFCGAGTVVVELMPQGKYQPCYPWLSRLGDLRHYLVTAKRRGLHQDMHVPLDTIRSVLADALAGDALVRAAPPCFLR